MLIEVSDEFVYNPPHTHFRIEMMMDFNTILKGNNALYSRVRQ
jgi:hypothetical protein